MIQFRKDLTENVFVHLGVVQRPSSVCGRHQCPRPAPGPAGKLLVRGRLLQSGLQRGAMAEGETTTQIPCFTICFYCAVGFAI